MPFDHLNDVWRPRKKLRPSLIAQDDWASTQTPVTPASKSWKPRAKLETQEDTPISSNDDPITSLLDSNSSSTHHINQTTPAAPPSPPSFTEMMMTETSPHCAPSEGTLSPVSTTSESMELYSKNHDNTDSTSTIQQETTLPSPIASPLATASPDDPEDSISDIETDSTIGFETQESAASEDTSKAVTGLHLNGFLNYFDSLSTKTRNFFIYELLRRSDTSQLRFIAQHVNPALNCDFLSALPPELGLHIIGFLDVHALCQAAQVSKTWRAMIDTYDKAWKDLLVADSFNVSKEEIEQAIREGWQFQGLSAFEKDMGREAYIWNHHLEQQAQYHALTIEEDAIDISKKRKSSTSIANKKRRKLIMEMDDVVEMGLPSLRLPHLYKTIYRRHYLVRNTWMNPESKPRHLAFRAHGTHVVTCLQFDDDKVLTGSDDTKIHVYDSNTGALRKVLNGHDGGVWALQYEGNLLVSGSTDRTVRVWDIEKGVCRHVFHGHTSTVRCLVIIKPTVIGYDESNMPIISPKEPLIITGSRDTSLRVWRLPSQQDASTTTGGEVYYDERNPYFIRALNGHTSSVRAIAAYGDTLVSGSYDSTVRVWKISTGESVYRLSGHNSKVYSVIIDVKRNRCISGSMDTFVKVWSLDTGECLLNLEGHTSLVGLLDLSFDRLVSAAADSSLRIWDPETGHCKSTLLAHTGAITCFQHDDQKVISGSDRSLKLWNVQTGEIVRDLLTDLSGGWQVRFNERKCVAAVQRRGRTYIEVSYLVKNIEICILTA
jgi:F-box and WD-40 domain protein CDC4